MYWWENIRYNFTAEPDQPLWFVDQWNAFYSKSKGSCHQELWAILIVNSLALAILIVKTYFDIGKNKKDRTKEVAIRICVQNQIVETDLGQKQELSIDVNCKWIVNCDLAVKGVIM